jgi:hypothetical protein
MKNSVRWLLLEYRGLVNLKVLSKNFKTKKEAEKTRVNLRCDWKKITLGLGSN